MIIKNKEKLNMSKKLKIISYLMFSIFLTNLSISDENLNDNEINF